MGIRPALPPRPGPDAASNLIVREDIMQHAQSRLHSRIWIGRGALASFAALIALAVQPALPALAATHVQVCTSPDGKTWQAADLGPGGTEPHGGQHPVMALSPDGHAVTLWGSAVGCPSPCAYILQAAVRPPGGSWGAPVTLSSELYFGGGGVVLGMDGSGNAIAAWVGSYADASHYAVLPAGGSWGPAQTLSTSSGQGAAHSLSLAVSPDGSAVVAFAGGGDGIWAASGSIKGGFSAPVHVAAGD
jgi:hypothetical protein